MNCCFARCPLHDRRPVIAGCSLPCGAPYVWTDWLLDFFSVCFKPVGKPWHFFKLEFFEQIVERMGRISECVKLIVDSDSKERRVLVE